MRQGQGSASGFPIACRSWLGRGGRFTLGRRAVASLALLAEPLEQHPSQARAESRDHHEAGARIIAKIDTLRAVQLFQVVVRLFVLGRPADGSTTDLEADVRVWLSDRTPAVIDAALDPRMVPAGSAPGGGPA